MFARVVRGVVREGKMDELIRAVQDGVVPAVGQQPGAQGLLFLTDSGSGETLSISLWDSPEAMAVGETSGYLAGLLDQVAPLLEDQPSVRDFSVSAKL